LGPSFNKNESQKRLSGKEDIFCFFLVSLLKEMKLIPFMWQPQDTLKILIFLCDFSVERKLGTDLSAHLTQIK
jgi:hypothetical protein